jgi:hypothetical protein
MQCIFEKIFVSFPRENGEKSVFFLDTARKRRRWEEFSPPILTYGLKYGMIHSNKE